MLPSEEIKDKINIADLIGEYVPLKKAGVNFRGVCPFHQEKTPSFLVSPTKQIWHCFGCGLGGDIFEFVKQIEGVEFVEALEILATRAGITLRRPTAEYKFEVDQKKTLLAINDLAAKFYAKVLKESQSAEIARQYLLKRGLKQETIAKWQIGYAPDDFHVFENFIVKKGYQKKEAASAGLLVQKDNGEFFDRFRGRVMFPLFDIHGRVVGFTARLLESPTAYGGVPQQAGKYVNSPETAIYSKSQLIYGLHLAKTEIRKVDSVIVVEGNVDVITCHEAATAEGGEASNGQAGFGNVVGSSGTAFTKGQLESLQRFTNNISFAFDVDEAGLVATRRAVELALNLGFNVRIISIPRGIAKDPDELIRKDRKLWEEQVKAAKHFLDFYFERIFANLNMQSSTDKKQAAADLLSLISLLPDPIERVHYVQKLASHIGVDERIVLELLNKFLSQKEKNQKETVRKPKSIQRGTPEILERRILGLLLKNFPQMETEWEVLQSDDFSVPILQEIFQKVSVLIKERKFDLHNFLTAEPKLAPELELLIFAAENELSLAGDSEAANLSRQFLTDLKLSTVKRKMSELAFRIRQAEQIGRREEAKILSTEFNKLTGELAKYHAQ